MGKKNQLVSVSIIISQFAVVTTQAIIATVTTELTFFLATVGRTVSRGHSSAAPTEVKLVAVLLLCTFCWKPNYFVVVVVSSFGKSEALLNITSK